MEINQTSSDFGKKNILTPEEILKEIYNDTTTCTDNLCLICMEEIDNTETKLKCGHKYHYNCIAKAYSCYSSKLRECPYCRKDGGYLNLPQGEKYKKHIHKKIYSDVKSKIPIIKILTNKNKKKIKLEKKCICILKTGLNIGKQCRNKAKFGEYCGLHKGNLS